MGLNIGFGVTGDKNDNSGFGNWVKGWTGQRGKEEREDKYYRDMDTLRQDVANTPAYTPPEEVSALENLYSTQAQNLRDTGENITDISRAKSSQFMYGGGEAQRGVRGATSAAVGDIQAAAGSSASFLGAISQLGQSNVQSMRNIAMQNQAFRDQSQRDYMQSLSERLSMESQAVGLESQGLQVGITESDKVYQSELERARASQQLEIVLAGNELARS